MKWIEQRPYFSLIIGLGLIQATIWESRSATLLLEEFGTNPAERGWETTGDVSLYAWNAAESALEVTWDSSKPNSFFLKRLGTIVSRVDDFEMEFRFRLKQLAIGTTPGKEYTFQIAFGLVNTESIAQPGFHRGDSTSSANLVEWNYFPDSGFGATVSPVVVSHDATFSPSFTFPLELAAGEEYKVVLKHQADTSTLTSTLSRITGDPLHGIEISMGPIAPVELDEFSGDFRADAVAICSYSDEGQTPPEFAGSVFGKALFRRIRVSHPGAPMTPPAPLQDSGHFGLVSAGKAGWSYTMLRSTDLVQWSPLVQETLGGDGTFQLIDTTPPTTNAWYRIEASFPIPGP